MVKSVKGFTIVELLIVIVVISILAAITVVAYNGIRQRASDSERTQEISSVQKSLELYKVENGGYPVCGSASAYVPGSAVSSGTVSSCLATALVPKYISSIPQDPQNVSPKEYYYAVGVRRTPVGITANLTNNYTIGSLFDTLDSTYYTWNGVTGSGPSSATYMVGSGN